MKSDKNYTEIIKNISNINKIDYVIDRKYIKLLKIYNFQFISPLPKDGFLIDADTVDVIFGTREVLSMKYESESGFCGNAKIISDMISSFSFGNDTTKFIEFTIKYPPDNNTYHIINAMIKTA